MKQRIVWIDYAKGIAILLVVYGHLLASAYNSGIAVPAHFFRLSDAIVYSFHMPLFFFLSGLLVLPGLYRRSVKDNIVIKCKRLLYPYAVWSFLQIVVEILFAGHVHREISFVQLLYIPFIPWAQFWFLYALFLMFCVVAIVCKRSCLRWKLGLLMAAAVGLFFFPLRSEYFGINGFSTGFLFFVAGMFISNTHNSSDRASMKHTKDVAPVIEERVFHINFSVPSWGSKLHVLHVMASLVLFVAVAVYVFENCIPPVRLPGGSHPLYYMLLSCLGIIAFMVLSCYLANRKLFAWLAVTGNYSLQIYLVHMLAGVGIRMILLHVFHIESWVVHILAGVVGSVGLSIIMYKICAAWNVKFLFELR